MNERVSIKGLAVTAIILFIGVGVQPAYAVNKFLSISDDVKDYYDRELSDDYQEIITFISGGDQSEWINRKGIFRGEIEIYSSAWGIPITLKGLRLTNGKVERFSMIVSDVHAYYFIGLIFDDTQALGFALSNIDWK
jgi:hypothetical protein